MSGTIWRSQSLWERKNARGVFMAGRRKTKAYQSDPGRRTGSFPTFCAPCCRPLEDTEMAQSVLEDGERGRNSAFPDVRTPVIGSRLSLRKEGHRVDVTGWASRGKGSPSAGA